jgi:L,D-transpeptidase ErfK/SrfK
MMWKHNSILCLIAALILGVWTYKHLTTAHLQVEIETLQKALLQNVEKSPILVIDTINNRLSIRQDQAVVHEAICATGSGKVLLGSGKRSWTFRTPQGLFKIQKKITNPIWTKPIWAFVEERVPVPELPFAESRYDSLTLGDYALALGDGYFIHGTIYTTFLGSSITHGCIRLDDEDLKRVYVTASKGTRVYIY